MKTIEFQKVLIALDYDPTAQKVAEVGYSLAIAMHAQAILLHIISDPLYYYSTEYSPIMGLTDSLQMGSLQLDNIEGLRKASQHFLDKTKHHLGDEAILTEVKEGELADTILTAAKELHADIIVMGSHSRKWLENIIMGSVTEEVLHHTTRPLFIVPTKKTR